MIACGEFKVVCLRDSGLSRRDRCCYQPAHVARLWRKVVNRAPWFDESKESAVVFLLDVHHRLIGFNLVSVGSLDTCLAGAREVFRPAIVAAAANVVLAHNHPSGSTAPSVADVMAAKALQEAGKIIGIPILDSVIIGAKSKRCPGGYSSLLALRLITPT